jgi:hypothetical protein
VNTVLSKDINPSLLIKKLGILCTSPLGPDKLGIQVFLAFVSLKLRDNIFS